MGRGVDMLVYDGTLHVQTGPGYYKTANSNIQRALYLCPNATLLTDVATT